MTSDKFQYHEEWWWVRHDDELQPAKVTWEQAPGADTWFLKWVNIIGETDTLDRFDVSNLVAKLEPPRGDNG